MRFAMVAWYQEKDAVDLDAFSDKWQKKYEKKKQAGWVHSMCLKCFRKHWLHGIHTSFQQPAKFRQWEVCCFCLGKHEDGIHITRDPLNR